MMGITGCKKMIDVQAQGIVFGTCGDNMKHFGGLQPVPFCSPSRGNFFEFCTRLNGEGLVTIQETRYFVIPAQAGSQCFLAVAARLDPGLRRGDELFDSIIWSEVNARNRRAQQLPS
jgi:hypothetical protein